MLTPEATASLARTTLLVQRDIYPKLNDQDIAAMLVSTPVRLTASRAALDSRNGQTALVTTTILSAELGCPVMLDFPEHRIIDAQPPLRGDGIRESLLEVLEDLITPARTSPGDGSEFEIGVGREPQGLGVSLAADDWGFSLAAAGLAGGFEGTLPLGAGLGSVAASAELFRHVMGKIHNETGCEPLPEHPIRDPVDASVRLAPFTLHDAALGNVDSISAGAITTAALYLLLRVPELRMHLRLIDDDIGAATNLNRYLLLRRSLLDTPKATALATFGTDFVRIESEQMRFDETTQEAIQPLASRVIVGVDDIPSRWRAQEAAPGWLGVGATSHFEVVVSEHSPGLPCAGCLHPHDDAGPSEDIPTVSFVSAMSGFLLAYRLLRTTAGEASSSQTLAYPFNLAGERPVWELPVAARRDCPVKCAASATVTQ